MRTSCYKTAVIGMNHGKKTPPTVSSLSFLTCKGLLTVALQIVSDIIRIPSFRQFSQIFAF